MSGTPAFSGATFDVEDGSGDLPGDFEDLSSEFSNPLSARTTAVIQQGADGGDADQPTALDAIAANESEMTEDELEDLIYAFQAADMDGGGAIDADEFGLMLQVMGCEITEEQVAKCIEDARIGYAALGDW